MLSDSSLLLDATRKLIELRLDPRWANELPFRCPPILWFGNADAERPKVLTLGANPSRQEFLRMSTKQALAQVGRCGDQSSLLYLEPPKNRFRLLCGNESLEKILTSKPLRAEIIAAYNAYFDGNPYRRWFGRNTDDSYNVEGFLRGFGASYYVDGAAKFQALHIDLFPFATLRDFGQIRELVEESLFATSWAQDLVRRLVTMLSPSAVIIFGRANCRQFAKHFDPGLMNDGQWQSFGAGSYFIAHSAALGVPVVGLSTNLGNPKGFNRSTLHEYGAHVRRAFESAAANS